MGLSLKKLVKGISKVGKKVVKVVKKVAPIALSLAGGPLGAATGIASVAKTASKLKSAGTNIAKAAALKVPPIGTAVEVMKAAKGLPGSATRSSTSRPSPTTNAAPKAKAPKAPSATKLKKLFKEWDAAGRPGDWETFARSRL